MITAEPVKLPWPELKSAFCNMYKYGGGFARSLANAWLHADETNAEKIEDAFPELIEKYSRVTR